MAHSGGDLGHRQCFAPVQGTKQEELGEGNVAGGEFARKVGQKTALEVQKDIGQFAGIDARLAWQAGFRRGKTRFQKDDD